MPRTYLITGATGIAAETARLLARSAAAPSETQIFLCALQDDQGAALVSELRGLGVVAEHLAGDLTDPEFAPHVTLACASRFGGVDALFNVAGISGRRYGDGRVHECTEEGWAVTLDTNLTTQYRMCREVVRLMLQQPLRDDGQRGVILNMASILGMHPEPNFFDTVAYAASKGAIIAMSRTIAASYAHDKIRVNAIAPALTQTPMSARASENGDILSFIQVKQPLSKGLIPVGDVASASVFLLTDASRSITGHTLIVDAGWSIV